MSLSGKALKAGVMGWPVEHSRSPVLHGHWLEKYAVDGAYVPMAVKPENLTAALRALPILGFAGCNLTIPHKEAALASIRSRDGSARSTRSSSHRMDRSKAAIPTASDFSLRCAPARPAGRRRVR
jgi:shikimate 5-dehydrogenase